MNYNMLTSLVSKPSKDTKGEALFWNDPYIAERMLEAHLDDTSEQATRSRAFVKASVDWISTVLPVDAYPELLDLGCGPGIYAEQFHEAGYQVTGVDVSPGSISYAKASAQEKGYAIQYQIADYLQASWPSQYELITMIYCDFAVLTDSDRTSMLQKILAMLKPGGCFLFDVFTPKQYEGRAQEHTWRIEEDGFWSKACCLQLSSFYRYDETNTFLQQYTILQEESCKQYLIWDHTFTQQELFDLLMAAGFSSVSFYGSVAGAAYDPNGKTIAVLAYKSR